MSDLGSASTCNVAGVMSNSEHGKMEWSGVECSVVSSPSHINAIGIMAGPIRMPIDAQQLERYIEKHVPEIKTPLDVKQVRFYH